MLEELFFEAPILFGHLQWEESTHWKDPDSVEAAVEKLDTDLTVRVTVIRTMKLLKEATWENDTSFPPFYFLDEYCQRMSLDNSLSVQGLTITNSP